MGASGAAQPRTSPCRFVDEYDPDDLEELLLDIQRGLRFICDGQGYAGADLALGDGAGVVAEVGEDGGNVGQSAWS